MDAARIPESLRLMLILTVEDPGTLPVEAVKAAIAGGVTALQFRSKTLSSRARCILARRLVDLTRPAGIPCLVNDRPDVAMAAGARGVHVGPDDLPPLAARRVLGAGILGVSVRTPERLREAEEAGADYLGVGALRATPTKTDTTVIGLEGIRRICRASTLPVLAVGGVVPGDVPGLREAGAAGIAVSRGILGGPDPERAARSYRLALDG